MSDKPRIALVGAAALIQQAEERGRREASLTRDSIRIQTMLIMIKQFKVQCNAVPVDDPVRQVIETMLQAFEKVLTK